LKAWQHNLSLGAALLGIALFWLLLAILMIRAWRAVQAPPPPDPYDEPTEVRLA